MFSTGSAVNIAMHVPSSSPLEIRSVSCNTAEPWPPCPQTTLVSRDYFVFLQAHPFIFCTSCRELNNSPGFYCLWSAEEAKFIMKSSSNFSPDVLNYVLVHLLEQNWSHHLSYSELPQLLETHLCPWDCCLPSFTSHWLSNTHLWHWSTMSVWIHNCKSGNQL